MKSMEKMKKIENAMTKQSMILKQIQIKDTADQSNDEIMEGRIQELEEASIQQAEIIQDINDAIHDVNIGNANSNARLKFLEMIAAKDVKKRKWMKLFALTAIGPLSAIFDLHHTDLYINNKANDVSRDLGKEIILETREVALADGVDVSEDECLFMFNKIVDSMQTNKSSMAFDVQYKRKTEIDFISGAVSKIGKKNGVKTPLNDSLIILFSNLCTLKTKYLLQPHFVNY